MSNWNSKDFMCSTIKHGLLAATASRFEAYQLEGFLLRDELFRQRRLKLGLRLSFAEVIESLTREELAGLKERATGVLQFKA